MSIVKTIECISNVNHLTPATHEEIQHREDILDLMFASEYKEYLLNYGVIWFDGHEITGICNGKRLDVMVVTKDEKKLNPFVPNNWYVIETLDIDGIVIWQSPSGEIYQSFPNGTLIFYAESFEKYIKKL